MFDVGFNVQSVSVSSNYYTGNTGYAGVAGYDATNYAYYRFIWEKILQRESLCEFGQITKIAIIMPHKIFQLYGM